MPKTPAMSPSQLPAAAVVDQLSEPRRLEAATLIDLMTAVTGEPAIVWAGKILGFGSYRYDSGHEGTAPLAAFAPTAKHHTVYLVADFQERYPKLLAQLAVDPDARMGRPRMSKVCLYLPRLDAVRLDVLRSLVERSARVHRGADAAPAG